MQITRFRFDNFKSLVDFELPLAKLSCLIGLNGSGKTTVIQGLDFLSRLFVGDINGWLNERGWVAADINSKLIKKSNVDLRIEMTDGVKQLTWSGSFNRSQLRCTKESLRINGEEVFSLRDGKVDLAKRRSAAAGEIAFEYSGSVLSALKPETLGEEDMIDSSTSCGRPRLWISCHRSRSDAGRIGAMVGWGSAVSDSRPFCTSCPCPSSAPWSSSSSTAIHV